MKRVFLTLLMVQIVGSGCYTKLQHSINIEVPESITEVTKVDSDTYINITMIGGYFYGGIDPMEDRIISIQSDGSVVFTKKHIYSGKDVDKYNISRDEVENIASFIIDSGFFEMEDIYDCSSYNLNCWRRKKKYPTPIPLRLIVEIGDVEKEIVVTVFEREIVNYPDGIDQIVHEIIALINYLIEEEYNP